MGPTEAVNPPRPVSPLPRERAARAALPLSARVRVRVLGREGMPATTRTALLVLRFLASLRARVGQVLGLRAEEQVVEPHARWVVAAVTDDQPSRNLAVRELPRRAMRGHWRAVVPREYAVPARVPLSLPLPTPVTDLHASHEAVQQRERLLSAALQTTRPPCRLAVRGDALLAARRSPAASPVERLSGQATVALCAGHANQSNANATPAPRRMTA
jgi:hypothetical protein